MGRRNVLIEGVSATGKTAVCNELRRRGYHALNGDTDLRPNAEAPSARNFPEIKSLTDDERAAWLHSRGVWDVKKVAEIIEDRGIRHSFFCGGFRNHGDLIHLFDRVFVLEIDHDTLNRRLAARPINEFGGKPAERHLIFRLHSTQEDVPKSGRRIDASLPIEEVVDAIVAQC